jgi:acetate kinase
MCHDLRDQSHWLSAAGGVGEHSAELRRRACAGLGFFGVELADEANEQDGPTARSPHPAQRCT